MGVHGEFEDEARTCRQECRHGRPGGPRYGDVEGRRVFQVDGVVEELRVGLAEVAVFPFGFASIAGAFPDVG
ncbi:MAG: hypothetical protein C0504_20225 [Candidatus Solibacter sp.]|nr:hypothetical protein [Candidatus Solibacter sp.]